MKWSLEKYGVKMKTVPLLTSVKHSNKFWGKKEFRIEGVKRQQCHKFFT